MSSASSFRRAKRVASIAISEIVQLSEAAAEMRRNGRDVVALGTGEPDFATPDHIKEAAHAAMLAGETRYPATAGTLALREAVCAKMGRDSQVDLSPAEAIISTGAKQVIFNAFFATLDEGEEVIIPAPYWSSYVDMVKIVGGAVKTVFCGLDVGFKLTPESLDAAIGPNTRWLLLNSPSNPTGAAYSGDELRALAEVLERHPHVWIIADEIYEHIVYGNFIFESFRSVAPQLADRTLIVNGVSKAYAMTGWRIGFGAGPVELIRAMAAAQGQVTSGASSIGQAAAVAAFNGPQDIVRERCKEFERRRDYVVAALNQAAGINCPKPNGAFYVFPSCAGVFGKRTKDGTVIEDTAQFCRYLLDEHEVVVVPGRAFGAPDHFRISYAYSDADLKAACTRIQAGCAALS